MKQSSNQTLILALNILARDIQTDDGVVNATLNEAANRIAELESDCVKLRQRVNADANGYLDACDGIATVPETYTKEEADSWQAAYNHNRELIEAHELLDYVYDVLPTVYLDDNFYETKITKSYIDSVKASYDKLAEESQERANTINALSEENMLLRSRLGLPQSDNTYDIRKHFKSLAYFLFLLCNLSLIFAAFKVDTVIGFVFTSLILLMLSNSAAKIYKDKNE